MCASGYKCVCLPAQALRRGLSMALLMFGDYSLDYGGLSMAASEREGEIHRFLN